MHRYVAYKGKPAPRRSLVLVRIAPAMKFPASFSSLAQRRLGHLWLVLALLLAQWAGLGHGFSHVMPRVGSLIQASHTAANGESSGQSSLHVCLDCLAYSALDAPLTSSVAVVPLLALGLTFALFAFHSWTPSAPRFFHSRAPPRHS